MYGPLTPNVICRKPNTVNATMSLHLMFEVYLTRKIRGKFPVSVVGRFFHFFTSYFRIRITKSFFCQVCLHIQGFCFGERSIQCTETKAAAAAHRDHNTVQYNTIQYTDYPFIKRHLFSQHLTHYRLLFLFSISFSTFLSNIFLYTVVR